MSIAEIRTKYPQYADMNDNDLATALHKKFYSDMPFADFTERIGLAEEPRTIYSQPLPPGELPGPQFRTTPGDTRPPYTAPEGTPMRIGPRERPISARAKPQGWQYASPIEKAVYAFDQSKVNRLLERFGKQFANAFARVGETIISHPFSPIGIKTSETESFRSQAADELEAAGFTGSPPEAELLIRQRAADLAAADRVAKFQIEPQRGIEDKVVDVGAGVASFIAQLALLKKILPKGTPDPVIWEIQNQSTGGIPGQGAAMRVALGGIGKIPVGSLKGKLAKVGLESGLFASVTAITGRDIEDVIVAGLIPVAFNAWSFAKQRQHIRAYETDLKAKVLQKHNQRLKRGMSRATSEAHLKADIRIVDNAVAKAKQTIYRDDAFAPAREKWEIQRKKALDMIATGKPKNVERGNAILDFLAKVPAAGEGRLSPEQRQVMTQTKAEFDAEVVKGGIGSKQRAEKIVQRGQRKLAALEGEAAAAAFKAEVGRIEAEQALVPPVAEKPPEAPPKPSEKIPAPAIKEAPKPSEPEAVPTEPPTGEVIEKKPPAKAPTEKVEALKKQGYTTKQAEFIIRKREGMLDIKSPGVQKILDNPQDYTPIEGSGNITVFRVSEKGGKLTAGQFVFTSESDAKAFRDEFGFIRGQPDIIEKIVDKSDLRNTKENDPSELIFFPKSLQAAPAPAKVAKEPWEYEWEGMKKYKGVEPWKVKSKIFGEWFTPGETQPVGEAITSGNVKQIHTSVIQHALSEGKPIPREVLKEYKGEKWAEEAIAGLYEGPFYKREFREPQTVESVQKLIKDWKEIVAKSPTKSNKAALKGWEDKLAEMAKAKVEKPTPKEIAKEKAAARRGIANIKPVLDIHKTFMRVLEPSKAVERKLGKDAYAAVIKAIHATDVARVKFEQTQLTMDDRTLEQLSEALNKKFSDEDLERLMLSRGTPMTVEAALIQRHAINNLPKDLKGSGIQKAIQQIADFNYKYLQSVVGDDINRVSDYFYGIYKDSKKVDKFLDYWRTTKRFTKEKKLPTYADAKNYGLKIRNPNPIENLKSEYIAIAHLEGMNWLKDELMRTGEGTFIDNFIDAPLEWDKVHDPTFSDMRLQPDLAKLINNLIATNKITKVPIANTLRQVNNVLRTVKFIGSAFHLLSVAKQSIADSGYLGFLYKPTALRGFTTGFRKSDPIFRTPQYGDYIKHGGGHRYAVESEARRAFAQAVNELNRNMGKAVKVGALPLQIPLKFVNWMFQSYIPKVKYAKYLDFVAAQEKKLGRPLKSSEKIDIIKEQQNFYGQMNERLFGRSGTVTTALRFYFMSPGYAEGNYRTMIKAATQWGGKEGYKASRSRSNIINSLILTGTLATIGTAIFTGKWPKKPETLEDLRDLFKIDTGETDDKGRRIMIDLMTYDKDYWQAAFNVLKGRPDVAVKNAVKRIGGMKAPTADMIVDLALISMGKAVYDWKGDRVTEITDPFLRRVMKLTVHEVKKLEPISVSVYKQSRRKDIDKRIAAIETLLGFRPTKTEKDKREQAITNKIYSLKGQQEKLYLYLSSVKEPRKAVERYNKTVKDILDSPMTPKIMKVKWEPKLIIDIERLLENKIYTLGGATQKPEDTERAIKYLKNFGVTKDELENYIRRKRARETKTTPISPLDRDRVIGLIRRIRRAKERWGED